MIVLRTKYHGPTNTLGSRISCKAAGRTWRVYVSYDHGSSDVEKHARALAKFCTKHFPRHEDEAPSWEAWHYGHDDGGFAFIRIFPRHGDAVTDCVWTHSDGRYSLENPE